MINSPENDFHVMRLSGGRVVALNRSFSRDEAFNLAAWLVAMASRGSVDWGEFEALLDKVLESEDG